jgi:hypothetical protein
MFTSLTQLLRDVGGGSGSQPYFTLHSQKRRRKKKKRSSKRSNKKSFPQSVVRPSFRLLELRVLGIDNCSGAWYSGLRVIWTTSSINKFSLFQPFQLFQTMLAIYGFHSENNFWKKTAISNHFVTSQKVCY